MNQFTMPPITPVPFNGTMAFAWVGVFLIIGMLLRATFPVFRKYLIPACIIGGSVGFFFQSFGLLTMTGFDLDTKILQVIVFHLFNLTWVYIGLRVPLAKKNSASSTSRTVFWFLGFSLLLTGVAVTVGIISSTFTNFLGLSSGPGSLGILTSYGFTQGPGQSLTIAKIWETASSFGGLSDFAMATSATGFVVAILVGIFLMNIIARKMGIETITNPSPSEECGYYDECDEVDEAGKITTSPSNIDVFAWHIALGLGVYFLTLILITLLSLLFPASVRPLLWTLFYLMCSATAICVRLFIVKIGKSRLLCNGVTARISNTLVDFLVCGTFISIQVGNIAQYLWPYIISCIVMTFTMSSLCWIYCSKLKEDSAETFAFMFGTFTGTISTGFVLLRMIDPQSKSQVPVNMALSSSLITPISMMMIPMKHMEVVYNFSMPVMISAWAAFALFWIGFTYMVRIPKTEKAWQVD